MSVQTERITRERLDEWAQTLAEHHATPILLVAIGHDETTGQLHVCVPEDVSSATIRQLVAYAYQLIG